MTNPGGASIRINHGRPEVTSRDSYLDLIHGMLCGFAVQRALADEPASVCVPMIALARRFAMPSRRS